MAQINDDYYEDLTPEIFAKLLDDLAAGRPVRTGSQVGRVSSEPVGGLTSLTSLYGADGHGAPIAPAPANDESPPPLDDAAAHAHAEAEAAHIEATLATLPADATPEQKADAVGERPRALEAPRGGGPDDLQRIKGVGPVNEKRLHELGVYHFEQIAAWVRSEIRWVATYLSFPGRIDREQWVAQAVRLAAGESGPKDDQTHTHLPTGKIGD
jgi:NADH-quinone oxidoreductase subunit E